MRVHDEAYVSDVRDCIVRTTEGKLTKYDRDTFVSPESWRSALLAAGAVVDAVDEVVERDDFKRAFCVVRPPGHHAGVMGAVGAPSGGAKTNGFCIFNNIAVGAAYALNVHRKKIK